MSSSAVSLPHNWDVVCGTCGVDVQTGSYCGGCRAVRYCGRECHQADWSNHRLNCMRFRDLRRSLYRHELPVSLYSVVGQYSADTTGVLAFAFPGASSNVCVFTRRTFDSEGIRLFVAHGFRVWRRFQWVDFVREYHVALQDLSDMIFVRRGMLRAATHADGDRDGVPVLRVRPLRIHLSVSRHRRICIALAALGMGLITGASRGGRSSAPLWYMHDFALVLSGNVPREWRHDLVFVGATPLLPRGLLLYRQLQNEQHEADVGSYCD